MTELPEAFLQRMQWMLGDEYDAFRARYQKTQKPLRGLRVNLLKCSTAFFRAAFPYPLEPISFAPEGFSVTAEQPLGRHPWHHAGLFYIQEPSAMSAVTALNPQPGMRVLDLCAAPGGKSTQIAARLAGNGLLISNEVVPSRARVLVSNLERCGVRNAVVTSASADALCGRLRGFFDAVLVDAPCSGEGMFRKEPQAAGEWSIEAPAACARRQLSLLCAAADALREGGTLVYSTCTFSPEENEGVIGTFLAARSDFTMEEIAAGFGRPAVPAWAGESIPAAVSLARRIFPQDGGEGHFVARLRRLSDCACRVHDFHPAADKNALPAFRRFWESHFVGEPFGIPHVASDVVSLLPPHIPDLSGLPVLRMGVPAGRLRGARFEPEHALYLACEQRSLRCTLDFPLGSPELDRFLHGETLEAPGCPSGVYPAVLAQGFPVGFGKCAGGILKNHYPKGLRNF